MKTLEALADGETLLGKCARPRPRLVCVDGRVVGDAVVVVSEQDPNWWRGMAVRRNGEIRVGVSPGRKAEILRMLDDIIMKHKQGKFPRRF